MEFRKHIRYSYFCSCGILAFPRRLRCDQSLPRIVPKWAQQRVSGRNNMPLFTQIRNGGAYRTLALSSTASQASRSCPPAGLSNTSIPIRHYQLL